MNQCLKDLITRLHSSNNSIDCSANPIGIVQQICESFEQEVISYSESDKHNSPSIVKECRLMYNELIEQKISEEHKERSNSSFKNIKALVKQINSSLSRNQVLIS